MKKRFAGGLAAVFCVLAALVLGMACEPAEAFAEAATSIIDAPEISAATAVVIERTTGTIIYDKNADETRYPASMTKVMTAIVVLEHANLADEVTVAQEDLDMITADSSNAGLKAGETLTVEDLLACLLLPSANESAYVLARHVGGTYEAFVQMMNEKAVELGCTSTHFVNPCGLHDDDHYTCAADMAKIMSCALDLPDFVRISGSATWDLPATSANPARTIENTDLLVNEESGYYLDGSVVAGKTGYTGDAGRCLAVGATHDSLSLVAVVMGSESDAGSSAAIEDMHNLLTWAYDAWYTGEVIASGDIVGSVGVRLSEQGDSVNAASTDSLVATVPAGVSLADLTLDASWTGSVDAPAEKGTQLGSVSVSYQGRELGSVSAVMASSLELSVPMLVMDWLSDPIHVVIVVVAFVAACAAIVAVCAVVSHKRQASRHRGAHAAHKR